MTWIYTRRTLFVLNLSRLFTVQLSMFFVVFSNSDMLSHLQVFVNNFFIFLFQFFRTDALSFCDSFDILSNLFRFVKNFFHFLFRSDSVLCDSLIILSNRQSFVNNYFILSGGVFSSLVCDSLYILANLYLFVNRFFHSFYLFLIFNCILLWCNGVSKYNETSQNICSCKFQKHSRHQCVCAFLI